MPRRLRPAQAEDQSARFIEAARELGCDEDEAAFDAQLAALARHKPKEEPEPEPDGRTKYAATR